MKNTSNCIIGSQWQKASHAQLLEIVIWPSMLPPRGLNPPSCFKMKSCLCHLSKSIFTPSFTSEQYILQLNTQYYTLLSFKVTQLTFQANFLNMDVLYINYFTVPLQRYSLQEQNPTWMLYSLIGDWFGCYWVLSPPVQSLPTTVWLLPWQSLIATTGNYQLKTSMKFGEKPQRFIKDNFCSILEYILSDHFMIQSIKMNIHWRPNSVLTSFQIKSVSTYLTLVNWILHSQTSMKMHV